MAAAPVPPFEPASYPGPRPDGPVLVHGGRLHPVHLDVRADPPVRVEVEAAVLDDGAVRWVVAYGSNACPGRLVDKGLDRRGALLLPAVLRGYVAAFEQRRTGYGAVPLTLVPRPGARTATWVLGVHRDDTATLDRTEGRLLDDEVEPAVGASLPVRDDARAAPPGSYRLAHVGEVVVADRFVLDDALAYLPGRATRVQREPGGAWRSWPGVSQAAAAAHVAADGPSGPPPDVAAPVRGAWPTSTLRARSASERSR